MLQKMSRDGTNDSLTAMAIMSAAMLLVPLMDVIAKALSATLPPLEVTFGRFLFQLLAAVAAALITGKVSSLKSKRPWINYLRGIFLALASLSFFTAVKFMPVATAISIFFVEPMLLTILAALILKEPFGMRRFFAILLGLAGALLILRPSFAEIGPAAFLPLCTALFFSFYLLLNRRFAGEDSLLAVQFSTGIAGSVLLGVSLLIASLADIDGFVFVVPTSTELGLLVLIGVISFAAHGLVIMAFQRGEASLLAPLQYLEIVGATLFGYLVFSDFPDRMTWTGISLIVLSGLYIAHRERKTRHLKP